MHLLHRHPENKGRTKAHGFTLLELAVALSAFALIAGVITLTMARTQLVNAGARLEKAARAELNSLLATAATSPYELLATDTFARPQACASAPEDSCVSVLGRTFEVTWTVSAGADLLQASTKNPAAVTLNAELMLPGNLGPVSVSRVVASPNGGKDGSSGIVRVRLDGAPYSGPVYLVDSANAAVASGQIVDGIASMRADAQLCSAVEPCRVALGEQGQSSTPTVTMSASSVTGEEAEIVLTADAVVEAGIVTLPKTQVSVGLVAINSNGTRGQPTQLGSVCLYLVFNDGTQQRAVPACNSTHATTITWDGYTDSNGNELALPQGVPMTLTTDNPSGTCSSIGQKGFQSGNWIPSAVCTSWTWGPIAGVSAGASANAPVLSPSLSPLFAPEQGTAYYRAIWTAPTGQPAAGLPGQRTWESPRTIPACAATNTCTPIISSIEPTQCPGLQCNSTAGIAPQLTAPLSSGSWKYPSVQVAANTRTTIALTVFDADQVAASATDRITATISSAPAGLQKRSGPTTFVAANAGDVLGTSLTAGSSLELFYSAGATVPPNTEVGITLADSSGNVSVTTIALWDTLSPYHVMAFPLTVGQGESNDLTMTVLNQAGNSMSTGTVTASVPSGAGAGPVVNDGNGQMRSTVSVSDLTRGSHQLTVSLPNSRQVSVPLSVSPRLGQLTASLSASQASQSGTVQVQISAKDRAGVGMSGIDSSVQALRNGEPALGVYAQVPACRTGAAGNCTVELLVEEQAPQGNVVVTAQNGEVTSNSLALTISGTASTITGPPVTLPQGTSEQNPVIAVVTVKDGDGVPRSGLNLDIGQRPSGVRAEALGPSDSQGQVRIALATLPGAQAGPPQLLPLSGSGAAGGLLVTIEATTGTLALPPGLTLAQGGTVSTTVTARDAQGQPMPNVVLTVTTTQPVDGPLSLRTGADGTAVLRLSVPAGAQRGTYPVLVSTGALQATSNVFVSQGVSQIVVIGDIQRGQNSTLTLVLRDNVNAPVAGREVTVVPRDYPSVSFANDAPALSAVSNAQGSITLVLEANPGLTTGVTVLDVTVDGRAMNVGVLVR